MKEKKSRRNQFNARTKRGKRFNKLNTLSRRRAMEWILVSWIIILTFSARENVERTWAAWQLSKQITEREKELRLRVGALIVFLIPFSLSFWFSNTKPTWYRRTLWENAYMEDGEKIWKKEYNEREKRKRQQGRITCTWMRSTRPGR